MECVGGCDMRSREGAQKAPQRLGSLPCALGPCMNPCPKETFKGTETNTALPGLPELHSRKCHREQSGRRAGRQWEAEFGAGDFPASAWPRGDGERPLVAPLWHRPHRAAFPTRASWERSLVSYPLQEHLLSNQQLPKTKTEGDTTYIKGSL